MPTCRSGPGQFGLVQRRASSDHDQRGAHMDEVFRYAIDTKLAPFWLPFGVRPGKDGVRVTDDGRFVATYGLLRGGVFGDLTLQVGDEGIGVIVEDRQRERHTESDVDRMFVVVEEPGHLLAVRDLDRGPRELRVVLDAEELRERPLSRLLLA